MANKPISNRNIRLGIFLFSTTEILIGSFTFFTAFFSAILGVNTKSATILIFIISTSSISVILGFGILRLKIHAYHMLLFLSTMIILSKILIFANIISLSGELETTIPQNIKSVASIAYHGLILFFFTRKPVKEIFGEKRKVLFSIHFPFKYGHKD